MNGYASGLPADQVERVDVTAEQFVEDIQVGMVAAVAPGAKLPVGVFRVAVVAFRADGLADLHLLPDRYAV
ncbi:hypothetical protein RZS08_06280, partial [Arthrospira platensis SPKY1]|nr:hypothetical protein [Arthrospira platensis SPKY1]